MARYNVDMREAIHALERGRVVRFQPQGKIVCHDNPKAAEEARKRFGKGGLAARIFLGLSVGKDEKYTVKDVIDAVIRIRKAQQRSPNASILTQRGIYEDRKRNVIVENSVQIVLIDIEGQTRKAFEDQILELAEGLVEEFEQESVIVEIQRRGLVTDVFEVDGEAAREIDDAEEDDRSEEE